MLGLGATVLARGCNAGHLDGIGVYTQQLMQGLKKRLGDGQVRPVVFGKQSPGWSEPHRCATPSFGVGAAWMSLSSLPYPMSDSWSQQLSLFHATDHYVPRLRGLPVIATVMDIIPLRHPEWVRTTASRKLMNWIFARLVRSADHVITISRFSADDIAEGLGISPQRITAIPLGVDSIFFEPSGAVRAAQVMAKYSLAPGYLLFIGTLQPRKNLERLLQAHGALPASVQQDHPLVVVGRDGWRTEGLVPRLIGAAPRVRWLRYVPQVDLLPMLQNALAVVQPSLYEGFGLPVLEGFAAGVPVITSNTTSIPEVAGDAALLVNPLSVEELRDAMMRLIGDSRLRNLLMEKGRKRASKFTWSQTVDQTLDVYRRFIDIPQSDSSWDSSLA